MRLIILLFSMFSIVALSAQPDSLPKVKYSHGFRFKEGIYVNHKQMINNKPIPKSSIISKFNKNSFDFFERLVDQGFVKFFDEYGLLKEMDISEIWGFSRKGSVFINWGDDFSRITVMGNICHFVSSITFNDNFMYGNDFSGGAYYSMPANSNRSEIQQFVMDFKTGKVYDYHRENILALLKPDQELYEEYKNLKKRKKKEMKFLFIRKFNEKHPLYIPIN